MLTFRQKIFLSYVLVFLVFLGLMTPFSSYFVSRVVENAMENRARELIEKIQNAPNNEGLVRRLKQLRPLIFFRVSVITDERKVLYDSHAKGWIGPQFSPENLPRTPEVIEAWRHGQGYGEEYSELLSEKFGYTAVAFDFHGKTYVLRTAFPLSYLQELISDFEAGFIFLSALGLILFSLMTWAIINLLTKPLQNIIAIVSKYRGGDPDAEGELKKIASSSQGEAGQLATTLVSLSERVEKQLDAMREERNEKEVLLNSLVEGVVATDRSLKVTFVNISALRFLGASRKEILNKPFEKCGEAKAFQLLVECQREQKPLHETLQLSKGGRDYFLDVVAAPKRDNTGVLLVMIDKTDHHKILEMRKEFIANASHELKTPITIIRGFAEALHDNPDLSKEMVGEITEKMVRNCDRMATLVRDLLALADIENIPLSRLERFDLAELALKVRHQALEVHPEAEIEVKAEGTLPIEIVADHDLIEMALHNLVQNAVKYSNPPAKVVVRIQHLQDEVQIEVSDQGIGIAEEELPRVFERFYRVDKARSRKMGGSGLGLSIVQTVIKKHHGRILAVSKLGEGSSFYITLPVKV